MRCTVGCGHVHRGVDIGYGIDVARGDAAHPANQGLACARGIRESKDPDGDWLTRPLVRKDGALRQTTWDVALARAVDGLREARERDPDAVAVLGSGQQTNEAADALGKVARGGFGTRNYDAVHGQRGDGVLPGVRQRRAALHVRGHRRGRPPRRLGRQPSYSRAAVPRGSATGTRRRRNSTASR